MLVLELACELLAPADRVWEQVRRGETLRQVARRRLRRLARSLWGDPPTRRVYGMRMARVNITVPDDLLERARTAGLNVSRLSASALSEELDRRARITALDRYLRELELELGPIPSDEETAAREWADRVLGSARQPRPGRTGQAV